METALTYFGILRAPTSWSKVCRELLSALVDLGVRVNIYERKGFLYDSGHPLPEKLQDRIDQKFSGNAVLTFEHPSSYKYIQGHPKVGMLTYETTVAPAKWIELVNLELDLLIVPSTFCREVFVHGGVRPEMIRILPHGYNPELYNRNLDPLPLETQKRVRFLSVVSPHKREGVEQLLSAYEMAFAAKDDVSLILKTNYLPGPKTKPFEHADLVETVERFQDTRDAPEVVLVSDFMPEEQMGRLYRSCSCLVSATSGEGFGMALLEALACGVPVIVTGWGGHLDFLNNENATLVEYELTAAKEIQYDNQSKSAVIARVNVPDLATEMRSRYEGRQPEKTTSPELLEQHTWKNVARQLVRIMRTFEDEINGR